MFIAIRFAQYLSFVKSEKLALDEGRLLVGQAVNYKHLVPTARNPD